MAGNTVQFVNSVASSPTVRLDLNDEVVWSTVNFDAPPPRLRRSISDNLLTPGGNVGAAVHEMRILTITLECITNTQDLGATEIQKLARELDRATNFIKYQPLTATKPVFFKTFKSDITQVLDMLAGKTYRTFTIEVLAESYAMGLQETIGAVTVNNDPNNGTNPCQYRIADGTVIGDVPAPARVEVTMNDATNIAGTTVPRLVSICPIGSGYINPKVYQFGSVDGWTAGTGFGAAVVDAAYSGGSYRPLTLGSTMLQVCSLDNTSLPNEQGTYKVLMRVKRSDTSSTFAFRFGTASNTSGALAVYGDTTYYKPAHASAVACWLDLGTFQFMPGVPPDAGVTPALSISLLGQRLTGAGTINADCIMLVPQEVAEGTATCSYVATSITWWFSYSATQILLTMRDDGYNYMKIGTANYTPVTTSGASPLWVVPGYANMVNIFPVMHSMSDLSGVTDVIANANSLTIKYYPRYLYVRPSAT